MSKITYKNKPVEVKVTNSTLMRFNNLGGDFNAFEKDPAGQSIRLACACLGLKGDVENHADDFLFLPELTKEITQVIAESGLGGEDKETEADIKKDNG